MNIHGNDSKVSFSAQAGLWRTEEKEDGTLRITAYCGTDKDVLVPAQLNGMKVTEIGAQAFWLLDYVTSVAIPDGVTRIGNEAFGLCSNLRSISISGSVREIGDYAFGLCDQLTQISVADNNAVYSFENGLLLDKKRNSVVVGIKSIVGHLVVPEGTIQIDGFAFCGCEAMTSISLPSSLRSIGKMSFSGCNSLTSLTLPEQLGTIEESSFSMCENLLSIHIPNSVDYIGPLAFNGCRSLAAVSIPAGVNTWKGSFRAFDDTTSVVVRPSASK